MKQIAVFGASGHGRVVVEIAEECGLEIVSIFDENAAKNFLSDYKIIQPPSVSTIEVLIAVGNNKNRKNVSQRFFEYKYFTLVHPSAHISKRAIIGAGTVVMAGAVINSSSEIGRHCIINSNSVIEHECLIEDFVHISPSAALAGNVQVGEGSHIGIGASVIQGVKIGKWCTIGAGAVIIRDVADGATVVGNPGRQI